MRSKANIKGHPLHPILIVFPISFYTATFVFELLYIIGGSHYAGQTAVFMNIAGIICAMAAAVPGLIDYAYTVPPSSSARKRATSHGLLNVSVLLMFIMVFMMRGHLPDAALLLVEAAALTLTIVAGWMGGTLVHRNQIGVDIRYAHAGKWKELYISGKSIPAGMGIISDLKTNQMLLIHFNGKRIVFGRTETGFVAFDDHCTHKGGSLAAGSMICSTVQCPWHGSQFDCISGAVKAGPAKRNINAYDVSFDNAEIVLKVKNY